MVSTGLAYLILPVRNARVLGQARIEAANFEHRLAAAGANFVYVFDAATREGRTWENDGSLEDVATGSAAGPVAADLVRAGSLRVEETVRIAQGRFVGRPSRLSARIEHDGSARVGGGVTRILIGYLHPGVIGCSFTEQNRRRGIARHQSASRTLPASFARALNAWSSGSV